MESIAEILKERKAITDERAGRKLHEWQLWALDFIKRYEVPKEEKGTVMATAKRYSDKTDYLRGVEGWMRDYPNLEMGKGSVRLLLWKLNKDKKDSEQRKKNKLIYM